MKNWTGRSILVIGAARQGMALARYLSTHGASVILNDKRPSAELETTRQAMQDIKLEWVLGNHPLALLDKVDLVCLSGGVPSDLPLVIEAVRRGLAVSNDAQVFMEEVPCPVIGITGSAGKTTTTTLVGRIAQNAVGEGRRVWVGGNIGNPLITRVDEMTAADVAVIELSSFQLEWMSHSPRVAAILNITPNHLDRHGTLEAYTAAKARLIQFQTGTDSTILNREDRGSWQLSAKAKGRVVSFGFKKPAPIQSGTWCDNKTVFYHEDGKSAELIQRNSIRLRGEHNLANVLAACAISQVAGFPPFAMQSGVQDFMGVAHRLEFVRQFKGADWYNDSIATAPERTMAAIRSFSEPLVLLLGGRDKNLPWGDLAALIKERVDHLILFGEAAGIIRRAIGSPTPGSRPFSVTQCPGLHQAVVEASSLVQPGQLVLLAPGGTSFDEFKDFEDRGEHFRKWVNQLTL